MVFQFITLPKSQLPLILTRKNAKNTKKSLPQQTDIEEGQFVKLAVE
jgi:hypothetical protein